MVTLKLIALIVLGMYQYFVNPVFHDPEVKPPLAKIDHKNRKKDLLANDEAAKVKHPVQKAVERSIKAREQDLKMSLPAARADAPKQVPAIAPLMIAINKDGVISVNLGPAKEQLDVDPKVRQVPLLKGRIEGFAAASKAAGQEPVVQIWADGQAPQQRVVDVINALAAAKISKITFVDLVDK